MRLLATIADLRVIRRILAHLGLPTEGPTPVRSSRLLVSRETDIGPQIFPLTGCSTAL